MQAWCMRGLAPGADPHDVLGAALTRGVPATQARSPRAWSMGRIFADVSASSATGSEAATIPQPA